MPMYTWTCNSCKKGFDQALTLKQYDRFREEKEYQHEVKCPKCLQYFSVIRTYEGAPGIKFGKGFFKDGYESAKNVTRKEE
jgi:hypothetical protein